MWDLFNGLEIKLGSKLDNSDGCFQVKSPKNVYLENCGKETTLLILTFLKGFSRI